MKTPIFTTLRDTLAFPFQLLRVLLAWRADAVRVAAIPPSEREGEDV